MAYLRLSNSDYYKPVMFLTFFPKRKVKSKVIKNSNWSVKISVLQLMRQQNKGIPLVN